MHSESTTGRRGAPPVPRLCGECGASFLTWAYKVEQGRGRFCGTACYHASRRTGITGPTVVLSCDGCGEPFKTWPYRVRDGVRFCSLRCEFSVPRLGEERRCEVCAAGFFFQASRARAGHAGLFCSNRCNGVGVKRREHRSVSRNSARYKEWRLAVYRRDDFTCQRCGKRGGHDLHAHHVKFWSLYPDLRFDVSNGKTLCRRCHGREHADAAFLR